MPSKPNTKIGVFVPTYNRPELLRACVLQLLAQTRRPNIICVHQNGTGENYAWSVIDLGAPVVWMHTPGVIAQNEWYRIPLNHLIAEECTHFFWMDHDDIYLTHHIETAVAELDSGYDYRISKHCGILIARPDEFKYFPDALFEGIHSTGGMSASMAFNMPFAKALSVDLASPELAQEFSDEVLARSTMPRFRCFHSSAKTTVYLSHAMSLSSAHWTREDTNFHTFPADS
jgi:hypothetical protein